MKFLIISLVVSSVACSTPYKARELESGKLEIKGSAPNGKIGINEMGQIVIRNERSAEFELRVQDLVLTHLRDDANSELYMLGLCRRDLRDPRLMGGEGEINSVSTVDPLQTVSEFEEVGLDEDGNLKIVQDEYFEKRLQAERDYEKVLRQTTAIAKQQREECEMKMAEARRKAGLPSERIVGDGYFSNAGVWIQVSPTEHSLSDAFEIMAERAALKKPTTEAVPAHLAGEG